MSSCLVKGCKSSWRKRDSSVSLHTFPKCVNRIRLWLQQIGQFTDNLEEMVLKVWMGTVNDSYRICSLHFTHDCYNYFYDRRTLRKDAIPSIFGIQQPPSVGSIGQIENSSVSYTDGSNLTLAESEAVSTSTTSVATYTNSSTTTTLFLTCSADSISSTSDSCLKNSQKLPLCADPYGTQYPIFVDTLTNSPALDHNTDFSIMCQPVIQHSSQNCFACGQKIPFVESSTNQQKKLQILQPDSLPKTDKHPVTTRDFATNTIFQNKTKSKKIQVCIPTKNKKISCCTLRSSKPQAHHSMLITSKNPKTSLQKNRLGVMHRVGFNLSRRWSKPYSSWKAVCKRSNRLRQCPTADQVNFKRSGSSQLARQDTSPNKELSAEYDPYSMAQKQSVSCDLGPIATFQDAYENFLLKKQSTFSPSTSATTLADECPIDHSVQLFGNVNSPESSSSTSQVPNVHTFHPND